MITLSLLQFLENNGYGTIDTNLFWQKLSLGKNGVYIVSIGQPKARDGLRVQRYQLYARGTTDVDGYERLANIVDFLNSSYNVCTLPKADVLPNSQAYGNVTIMPISTPTNIGEDTNGRIIWSATGELRY